MWLTVRLWRQIAFHHYWRLNVWDTDFADSDVSLTWNLVVTLHVITVSGAIKTSLLYIKFIDEPGINEIPNQALTKFLTSIVKVLLYACYWHGKIINHHLCLEKVELCIIRRPLEGTSIQIDVSCLAVFSQCREISLGLILWVLSQLVTACNFRRKNLPASR